MDPLSDMYNSMDERLPPVEKLERYFQSEDVMDRYSVHNVHTCMCIVKSLMTVEAQTNVNHIETE